MSTLRLSAFIRRLRGEIAAAQPGGLSDALLLERWLGHRDEAAFEVLLWRHGPMILGVCRRVLHNDADVEDAFQAAFLVLVRKAGAIRRGASVAGWLYRTTYRVALRARQRSDKQNRRETDGVEQLGAEASDNLVWRDVRPILDEEINRLPEKYRVLFIRCHLEGCTNEEAAVEMSCPVGTIHSRLPWARDRLRARLVRRGVTLGVLGMTAVLAQGAAPAAVPSALAETTLQAAFAFAAHSATAGVSAGAVALTKGVLRMMFLAKLKFVAAVLLAIGLAGGAGGLATYHLAEAAASPPRGGSTRYGAAPQAVRPVSQAVPAPRTIKVPSGADGELVFIATEIMPDEVVAAKKKIEVKRWLLAIKADEVPPEQRVIVPNAEKDTFYRPWKEEDGLPPNRLRVGYQMKTYRKLTEGDVVEKGQLLALVDTKTACNDLESKLAGIEVAESERLTSQRTKEEANSHYDRMINANIKNPGRFTQEDVAGAKLTWDRYAQEEVAKKAVLVKAQREANAAITLLNRHAVHAPVAGVIKVINRQAGEGVKKLETVLEILPQEE